MNVIDSYKLKLNRKETVMKKMLLSVVFVIACGSVGAFAYESMEQKTAKEMAKYNQTGEFEQCIRYNMIDKTTILDDTKIIFELKNDKHLLNTMNSECRSLYFEKQFSMPSSGNKICAKDVISTRRATCMLGKFEVLEEKS